MTNKRLLAAPMVSTALLTACSAEQDPQAPSGTCVYKDSRKAAKDVKKPSEQPPHGTVNLTLTTNHGDIDLALNADQAPCTVGAITSLAKQGYYDNTVCHRLTTQGIYVLQCGDPSATGSGGPGFVFPDEYPVGSGESPTYKAGTIAMANAGPNTNGSQFFLNYEDSPLPPNYTLFGEMTPESIEVVRAIAATGTATGGADGAPKNEVSITKATVK